MNTRRILSSAFIPIASLAILILYLTTGVIAQDVVNSYKSGSDYGEIIILFASFPMVSVFVSDWKTGFWRMITVRTTIRQYGVKIFLCVWSTTVLVAMIGQWLYIGYLSIRLPILSDITYTQPWVYDYLGGIFLYNHPYMYLFVQTVCVAIVCAAFAVLALTVSVKITDRLVAVFSPLILYYAVTTVMEAVEMPYYLRPNFQMIGYLTDQPLIDSAALLMNIAVPLVTLPILCRVLARRCENA